MSSYRSLLLELSNSLTTADLRELKFLCGDVIPAGRLERINQGFELFSALEQLNMLSVENRDFLASKLIAVNRNDLRNKLLGIQAGTAVMLPSNVNNRQVSDTLLHDLVEDLSTSWKMLGRRLGIPEGAITNIDMEHRRVVEKGMAMFAEWKRRRGEGATVGVLREALDKTGRRDLSERVRGSPIEERQPFPNLNPLRPALPIIAPTSTPISTAAHRQPQQPGRVPVPVTASLREPQEQAEPVHHAASNSSASTTDHSTGSTRIPRPPGAVITFSSSFNGGTTRQPIPEQAIAGGEVDVHDSGPGKLQSDGCFLDPEKYDPVKFLGSGGYAKVYLVVEKRTDKKMACKMCDLGANTSDTQKLVKSMETEVMALTSLKHEHIVEFFFVEHIHNTALLFLEYMEGGTLEDLLRNKGPLEEPLVVKFTRQLLSAVDFLHTNGKKHIVHKDIKGANILLDGAQKNIKLADFGICTIMEELRTATGGLVTKNNVASFHWTSPELLAAEEFSRNTDIWSVGCTVVEMLTTKPPLFSEHLSARQKMFRIINHMIEPPTNCTSLAYGFLKRCLCPKETRASAAELLADPYLN
ncbi:unnamed protein product [Porites evermanni]|uniref:Protein kinase domain-containing protein n=1 Tax=Porites evermanni TaxID=104178 RepID=A0ABN8QV13_9CNID|nr:unnamed protein product [Porites evermanni]